MNDLIDANNPSAHAARAHPTRNSYASHKIENASDALSGTLPSRGHEDD